MSTKKKQQTRNKRLEQPKLLNEPPVELGLEVDEEQLLSPSQHASAAQVEEEGFKKENENINIKTSTTSLDNETKPTDIKSSTSLDPVGPTDRQSFSQIKTTSETDLNLQEQQQDKSTKDDKSSDDDHHEVIHNAPHNTTNSTVARLPFSSSSISSSTPITVIPTSLPRDDDDDDNDNQNVDKSTASNQDGTTTTTATTTSKGHHSRSASRNTNLVDIVDVPDSTSSDDTTRHNTERNKGESRHAQPSTTSQQSRQHREKSVSRNGAVSSRSTSRSASKTSSTNTISIPRPQIAQPLHHDSTTTTSGENGTTKTKDGTIAEVHTAGGVVVKQQTYKLLVLGTMSCGKTSLLRRFISNTFTTQYLPTVGIDYVSSSFQTQQPLGASASAAMMTGDAAAEIAPGTPIQQNVIKLHLFDTSGSHRFASLIPNYLKDCSVVLICFDVTNLHSYEQVFDNYIVKIRQDYGDNIILIVVGCKNDLTRQRVVSYTDIKARTKALSIPYIETSAAGNYNVALLFQQIATILPEIGYAAAANNKAQQDNAANNHKNKEDISRNTNNNDDDDIVMTRDRGVPNKPTNSNTLQEEQKENHPWSWWRCW